MVHMSISLGPKKMTDQVVELLVRAAEHGLPPTRAAAWAGISYTTLCDWRSRGEEDRERDVDTEYSRLLVRLEQAEAQKALDSLDLITAPNKPWTAHAWFLEHRFPADFGTRQVVEMSGPNGGPIQTVDLSQLSQLSVEELLVLEKAKRVIDGQNNADGSGAGQSTGRLPYTPRSLPS